MVPVSPFNTAVTAEIIKEIPTTYLIDVYKQHYGIDLHDHFKNHPSILLCKCPLTSLEFFYPFGLDGDGKFYKELAKGAWYYQSDKWEHLQVAGLVKERSSVLEIGCGYGAFLKLIRKKFKQVDAVGLELNPEAVVEGKRSGVTILNNTLESYTLEHEGKKFDMVCSFQVFEHISSLDSIFKDSVRLLADGGTFVVSVPNNSVGFFRENILPSVVLNMPPHHVNHFNEDCFSKIGDLYGLELQNLIAEPLQQVNQHTYLYNQLYKLLFKSSFLIRAIWKLKVHLLIIPFLKMVSHKIKGHTIIAVYRKRHPSA